MARINSAKNPVVEALALFLFAENPCCFLNVTFQFGSRYIIFTFFKKEDQSPANMVFKVKNLSSLYLKAKLSRTE